MIKSKTKEPTSQGLTLKQMLSFHKKAKGVKNPRRRC